VNGRLAREGAEAFEVRLPRECEKPDLYGMLAAVFPEEDWLWRAATEGRAALHTWTPLCAILDGQVVGNVARFDMDVLLGGVPRRVAGIAGVATRADRRRRGVATGLMAATLAKIDADGLPSVLYTDLPQVYEAHGYRAVPQRCVAIRVGELPGGSPDDAVEPVDVLDADTLACVAAIYTVIYPNYDGKIVRVPGYWAFNRAYFDHNDNERILLCAGSARDAGYARVARESDRLLVSEFCCAPEDDDATRALLESIGAEAASAGVGSLTFALLPGHFLWGVLDAAGAKGRPEAGANREVFMVRGPGGGAAEGMDDLQWSLADRF